ncbi:MAG: tetratricopeptide repeat protein [Bacteroidales bacterium]|nr:tetratricopeptide repeat protein [Bacteroidales bacterium]
MDKNKYFKTGLAGVLFSLLLLCSTFSAYSQKSVAYDEELSEYSRAKELFEKEKYAASLALFDSFIENADPLADASRVIESEYLAAVSSIRLFNSDAAFRVNRFVDKHQGNPMNNSLLLELANQYYQSKNYRSAIRYYERVDRLELKDDLLPAYYFKFAYSHFMRGDRDKAMLFFSELTDIDTEYTPPAIYYFSHIAYDRKMYRTALEGFMRLTDDESFGPVVPFYIVQIMYIQEDYEGILDIAPGLLKTSGEDRKSELYRLIGDSYFKNGQYNKAAENLEEHLARAKRTGRAGTYQLAFCYYMTEDYDKAINLFQQVTRTKDELSQNAYYLLGDCYLKKEQKKMAQAAFSSAARMDYDRRIKEEALFNFAKLTYETTYSPFGEVIRAFQEYVEQFPASDNIEEAYDYLVSAYMKVKNYRAALQSLDRITHKDEKLERAYQRVAFYRGLELYKDLDLNAAVAMFDKSLEFGRYNREIRARSHYWKGETLHRLNEPERALDEYQTFMGIPGSGSLDEYDMVSYNIAYIYYNRKDYSEALRWFRKYENSSTNTSGRLITDVYNRIADCYYIATEYENAINYYNKVIENGSTGTDYALFRKGFALGLMNNQESKIQVLTKMIDEHSSSALIPNALFERGRAFINVGNEKSGEKDYKSIIASHQNSVFVPRAMVQLGLLYYNTNENDKAIAQFKDVIEKFRSTPEARNAMTGLKNTYMDMNDVESYFAFVRNVEGYGDVSTSERDSLLYISGENLYVDGNCERAIKVFKNYLNEFDNGSFRLNASFYLAECLSSQGNREEALAYYLNVASKPNNPFLEQAYQSLSGIYYLREVYDSSYYFFEKLEKVAELPDNVLKAKIGMMRSAYKMGDARKTITSSEKLLESDLITEEIAREASFMNAKSNFALGNYDRALARFRRVAVEVTSSEGAESKYRVAQILYKKAKYDESEDLIYEFIDQNTPHQYWMARMFILLADISLQKGDEFQARATLESLKDYYQVEDDGILDEVKAKLSEINMEIDNDTLRVEGNILKEYPF